MKDHVNHILKTTYLEIKRIKTIRYLLDKDTTSLLINSLVLSKMDYCNSLFVNITKEQLNRLQKVQNNAARLVLRKDRFNTATPLLRELHWLPVEKRIHYKICTIVFKILNDQCPTYLSDLVKKYQPTRELRSSDDPTVLTKHKVSRKIGERSFFYSAPQFWNLLPQRLREIDSFETFKSHLKTYLFNL